MRSLGSSRGCWGERQATWSRTNSLKLCGQMHWDSVDKCIETLWKNTLRLYGQMHWNSVDKCIETLQTNALKLYGQCIETYRQMHLNCIHNEDRAAAYMWRMRQTSLYLQSVPQINGTGTAYILLLVCLFVCFCLLFYLYFVAGYILLFESRNPYFSHKRKINK